MGTLDDHVLWPPPHHDRSPADTADSPADHTTPATSPDCTTQFVSTAHFAETSPWHREEASCILHDINNFIPLGCLVLASGDVFSEDSPPWTEVFDVHPPVTPSDDISGILRKLCSKGWVRIFASTGLQLDHVILYRIYLLAMDVGNRVIDRGSSRLMSMLVSLLQNLDVSPATWKGQYDVHETRRFDIWASSDQESLFYMFNKIPSPSPDPSAIGNHSNRKALIRMLDSNGIVPGLTTDLYPYQRRSAGQMLQRESDSRLVLDPRVERRLGPDQSIYYYGARNSIFLRNPPQYESVKGGILAETMGLGKTLICIALVLSTKGHLPRTPPQYDVAKKRSQVSSLWEMAVSTANRNSLPWKAYFEALERSTGESYARCIHLLQASPPSYEIPQDPPRWNRNTTLPPPKKLILAPTTLIVVPRNLCSQWESELRKHVSVGSLSVLVMDDVKDELPASHELRTYDVVLFSRQRFEQEIRDGADAAGRRATTQQQLTCACPYIGSSRVRDCTCLRTDDVYHSTLKQLHFLRIIIDEGHFFSNSNSTAVHVASKLVRADHRWVVSGTPAKDLLGVEMDLYSSEASPMALNDESERRSILEQRKTFNHKEDTAGAIKSIGSLASQFLQVRPWSGGDGERGASWEEYVYRHEHIRRKTYSGFSRCLREVLQALVVKTQPEDVERDISLPPLTHNVIRLHPSFYDILTVNLFALVLTANAVTSERTDPDYLFHKNSQKARWQLTHNLRQSAFFWTGFSIADVEAAMKHGQGYLAKEDATYDEQDCTLLEYCIEQARVVLESPGWNSLSVSHEIGLFCEAWPTDSAEMWTFDSVPPLIGATQLHQAQTYVNARCMEADPTDGLGGAGVLANAILRPQANREDTLAERDNPVLVKLGIPSSSVNGEPSKKRISPKSNKRRQSFISPSKVRKSHQPESVHGKLRKSEEQRLAEPLSDRANAGRSHASPSFTTEDNQLPEDSPLRETRIIGTTSAKLSYLVSQVCKLYKDEKILIFYDGDNIAFYIAQVLELLHIPHLIYAKSLKPAQKSQYIVQFQEHSDVRVMIMDVQQAAFGLNLSSASRVYFVNPVCRPQLEAQAIKRAHRIGQTRPVVAETLILEGTLEEQMFERAKRMSRAEHKEAKVLEDDGGMKQIVQSARPLEVTEAQRHGYGQVAFFETPQQLWSRPGWATWNSQTSGSLPRVIGGKRKRADAEISGEGSRTSPEVVIWATPKPPKYQKTARFAADVEEPSTVSGADDDHSDHTSQILHPVQATREIVPPAQASVAQSTDSQVGHTSTEVINHDGVLPELAVAHEGIWKRMSHGSIFGGDA